MRYAKATVLPQKPVLTRNDIQEFLNLDTRQTDNRIQYLKRKQIIEAVGKGVFVITSELKTFDERNKLLLANSLFPEGYITGYEALRYWSIMSPNKYFGICLRVDPEITIAVSNTVARRSVTWRGFRFVPVQFSSKLRFGLYKSVYGLLAEPEKAVLDLMYMGLEPDNIEWSMLDADKLKKYALRFPPRVRNRICP